MSKGKLSFLESKTIIRLRNIHMVSDLKGDMDEQMVDAYIIQNQILEFINLQLSYFEKKRLEKLESVFRTNPDYIRWALFALKLQKDKNEFLKYKDQTVDFIINDLLDFAGEYYSPLKERVKPLESNDQSQTKS